MSMTDFIGENDEETFASLYDALAEMVMKNPDRAMITIHGILKDL